MGNDGGTIMSRRDIVVRKKSNKRNALHGDSSGRALEISEISKLQWGTCRISEQPLDVNHIVCCKMGYLYNKDSLLERLIKSRRLHRERVKRVKSGAMEPSELIKESLCGVFDHIRGMDDVVDVHFELNVDHSNNSNDIRQQNSGGVGVAEHSVRSQFICPVSRREIYSPHHFYLMRKCGHVVSERAIQETQQSAAKDKSACLVCGVEYDPSGGEITLLNPPEEIESEQRKKLVREISETITKELEDSASRRESKKKKKRKDRNKKKRKNDNDGGIQEASDTENNDYKKQRTSSF